MTGRTLEQVRATYGAVLVFLPGPVIWLATGRRPGRRACRVARVLGVRHLVQAAVTSAAPEPAVLAIGGQVDAVHAASMVLLALVSRGGRRAALADALTEAVFAAAGGITVATGGFSQDPAGSGGPSGGAPWSPSRSWPGWWRCSSSRRSAVPPRAGAGPGSR